LETQHAEHQERLANVESLRHGELLTVQAEYQKKSEEVRVYPSLIKIQNFS
jgi:hypothetical protein